MNSTSIIAYIELARKRSKEKKYHEADAILQGIQMILVEENNPFD